MMPELVLVYVLGMMSLECISNGYSILEKKFEEDSTDQTKSKLQALSSRSLALITLLNLFNLF